MMKKESMNNADEPGKTSILCFTRLICITAFLNDSIKTMFEGDMYYPFEASAPPGAISL